MPSKIVVARKVENNVQTYSDNLILSSVILNTTVVSTVRPPLGSRRNVIPIKKTLTVMAAHCLSPRNSGSHYQATRSVYKRRLTAHPTALDLSPNKWKEGSCELHDHVFETDRRRLELRAILPFYPCTKRVRVIWRRQYFENVSNSIV
jgi:hypothetical protein